METKTFLRCSLVLLILSFYACATKVDENALRIIPQVTSRKILNLRNDASSIEHKEAENLMKSKFLNTRGEEYGYYRVEFDINIDYLTDGGFGSVMSGLTLGLYNLFGGPLNSNDIGLAAGLSFYDSSGTLIKRYQNTGLLTQQAGIYYGSDATKRVSERLTEMFAILQREADKDSDEINRALRDAGPISKQILVASIPPTIPPPIVIPEPALNTEPEPDPLTESIPEKENYLRQFPHQFIEHEASQKWSETPLEINPKEIIDSDTRRPGPQYYIGSSQKEFWVQDKDDNWQQINATLRGQGEHSNIWVADASFDAASKGADGFLIEEQAANVAKKFDAIYVPMTNLFGFEFGGGPTGNGGLDADKRVQILVYAIPKYTGYFWGKDAYKDELGERYHSNMSEIIYFDARRIDSSPDYMYTGMIHVFQYLINFNQKNLRLNKPIDRWYNGMLAEMAEDVIAPYLGISWSHPAHVIQNELRHYIDNHDQVELTDWQYGNIDYNYYAQACAFGAYLARNFGGAELVRDIMLNDRGNLESIDAALALRGSSYNDARSRFSEVLHYSTSKGMPEGVYSFDKTVEKTINAVNYVFTRFDPFNVGLVEIKQKFFAPEILEGAEVYEIKQGDRLRDIAGKLIGEGDDMYYFPLIMLASSIEIFDPDLIHTRKELLIPKLEVIRNNPDARETAKRYLKEAAAWYRRNKPNAVKTPGFIEEAEERL